MPNFSTASFSDSLSSPRLSNVATPHSPALFSSHLKFPLGNLTLSSRKKWYLYSTCTLNSPHLYLWLRDFSLRSPSVFIIVWQTCTPWVDVQQAPQRTTKLNSSQTKLNSSSHPQLKPWMHLERLVFISYLTSPKSCQYILNLSSVPIVLDSVQASAGSGSDLTTATVMDLSPPCQSFSPPLNLLMAGRTIFQKSIPDPASSLLETF